MKQIIFLFIALSIVTTSAAQDKITLELNPFNALVVSGRIDLELIPSESNEMTITAKNGNPQDVTAEITEGELKIKIRTNFEKEASVIIALPYQELTRIEVLNGAMVTSARDLETKFLELNANTGGKIELSLNVEDIQAKVTKMSDIILYGKAESQNVAANSGGNYSAYELDCEESYARSVTGAQVKVTASKLIDAEAKAKAYIGYIGQPSTTHTQISTGGEIASFKFKEEIEESE